MPIFALNDTAGHPTDYPIQPGVTAGHAASISLTDHGCGGLLDRRRYRIHAAGLQG